MYDLKNSLSLRKKDNDVQRLTKKATHHTNVDEDWNLFIKICTEVNCTKGASQKARIALSKYLCAFKEPQTQYLAFSLLREICTNCSQFEVELRNKDFIDLIRDLWYSNIHQKVRDNFALCISIWVNAYRDDLYFHHLMNFCNSVYRSNGIAVASVRNNSTDRAQAWFRQSSLPPQQDSPSLSPNSHAPIGHIVNLTHTSASRYHDNSYTPNNFTIQQRNDQVDDNGSILDDIQRPIRTPSLVNPFLSPSELHASASSSTSNRDTAYNMILRTSKSVPTTDKGKARLNTTVASMSRHDMDALIYEAETAAKLLTDLTDGPVDSNVDTLEDLNQTCRSIHARIIKQLFSLEGDHLYHDALTDSARSLFIAITQYKKMVNEKLLIEA